MVKISKRLVTFLHLICTTVGRLSIPIDNGVKGYPQVTCGVQSLRVDIDTEKVFQGRVFIKGESGKKECIRSFAQGPSVSVPASDPGATVSRGETVGIELGFNQCSMRRHRTLVPRGVGYSFTLVISFHSLFITKVDKAYRIRCFYTELEKTVAQQFDVSMLSTHAVNEQFPIPQCRYYIRRGDRNGPPLRFARVGEPVFHVWECDSPASVLYALLVRNCFVDDGQGSQVELIDEKGCANDKHLIPNLSYNNEVLETFSESRVFKYADKPTLYFACTIILCVKEDGGCNGITPPNCGSVLSPPSSAPIPAAFPGIVAESATYANQPQLSLSYEEFFKNFTKSGENFATNENISTNRLDTNLKYNFSASKNRKHKRGIANLKSKPFVLETDLNAQPFVVLPFGENSESDFNELNQLTSHTNFIAAPSHSLFTWKSESVNNAIKPSAGTCISLNRFGLILALIFLLLVFSTSLIILYIRNHSKILEKRTIHY